MSREKIKMLNCDGIYVSGGIDVNKTSVSKEYDVCHYCFFFNYSFKFQPNACHRSHDLRVMSVNLSDIAILNIKDSYYYCIISLFSTNEVIDLLQNAELTEKR